MRFFMQALCFLHRKDSDRSAILDFHPIPWRPAYARKSISPSPARLILHRGSHMPNSDLIPPLLHKLNENQLALEAAIMELTIWIEQQGSSAVGGNVRGALEVITLNEEFISASLTTLCNLSEKT